MQTTVVIYPSVGLLGAACVRTSLEPIEVVLAKGCTERDRFDLAIEVPRYRSVGLLTWGPDPRAIPKDWQYAPVGRFFAAKA